MDAEPQVSDYREGFLMAGRFQPLDIAGNYFAGRNQALGEQTQIQQNALAGRRADMQERQFQREETALNDEQKKQFATIMVQAAQYGMQSPTPKAFIEKNYPQLAQLAGPEWQALDDNGVKAKLQESMGVFGPMAGIGPQQPKGASGALYKVIGKDGKPVYGDAESARGQPVYEAPRNDEPVNSQILTRPVGNGLVQDYSRDPRTGRRVPEGQPYRPVTPHTGNVTEGERKAAALGTRLEAALQEIGTVEAASPGSSRPGLMERGLEAVGAETAANAMRSGSRQRADTAQLDALDAALTLATGAAYTREQLMNLRKSYFPQIGDSDQAVQAKAKRFQTIVETARIAAGRAEPSIDRAVNAGAGAPVRVNSPQEAMALPSGTKFITPDGRIKVRP